MGHPSSSLVSFRGSLLGNLITLVLLIGGGLLPVVLLTGSRAIERLSASMIERSTSQARAQLDGIFLPVETVLRAMAQWARTGLVGIDDRERFNAHLMPVLEHSRNISSVLLADDRGRELMLMQDRGGWQRREVGVDGLPPGVAHFVAWDVPGEAPRDELKESNYSPASRPWYISASSAADDLLPRWTEPYRFRTSKELGLTASLRWRDKAGRPASAASLERALSQCADAEGWSQADARGWWELHAQAIRGTRADPQQATDALLTVKLDER